MAEIGTTLCAHLVVRAVRAGHKLAVRLQGGEPRLEVVLLGGGVVQLARHDVHDVEREAQGLVEVARDLDHLLLHRRRLLRRGDAELLDLWGQRESARMIA